MMVTVRLFSHLVKYLPPEAKHDTWTTALETDMCAGDLLTRLGFPPDIPRAITVNDENHKEDVVLQEGDVLKVFPVAMGG
ncbi:MoaD/ThiS family protein [Planctomycetota bacterium]